MQKVQGCILLLIMFIFSKQELRKTSQVSVVFHDEFAQAGQCYSIKCKKRNHKYRISRTKLFTSGDINCGHTTGFCPRET